MSTSRILLGYRDIKEDRKKSSPADDDGLDDLADMSVQREWSLNRPNDVVIIDDVQMMNSFQEYIIAAPQEEHLEEFYAKLGTRKITELVKEEMRIGALLRDQEPAQRLRKEIVQRAQIFLHEHERDASKKSIKHDANWLDTHLSVKRVSDITVTRTLAERGASAREIRTASISKSLHSGHVLNVTARFDNFEVARELIQLLIRRSRRNDIIALERILTEPLQRLQAKGINVERILRRKEHQARIAKQREETEREQVREQEVRDEKKAISANPPSKELSHNPSTPEKSHNMPGAFGTPEKNTDLTDDRPDVGGIGNWAKKFFKNNTTNGTDTGRTGTDGPQINRDIQVTKSNIADAINRCGPSNQNNINTPHHRDPTELDKGGYCSGEQWENLHKSFTVSHAGRKVDIFYGQHQTETAAEVVPVLGDFLQLIFALTGIFGVNPAAVSIFLDDKSNTVAFNLNGSIFFNLSWFRATDSFNTVEGKIRACDSWFLTYCHELAHNLVKDHNARHNWYTQQIAIEYSPKYRNILNRILGDMGIAG